MSELRIGDDLCPSCGRARAAAGAWRLRSEEAAGQLQNPPSGAGLAEDQEISAGLRCAGERQPFQQIVLLEAERDALQKKVDALAAVAAGACQERDALQAELSETGGIQAMARLNKKLTDQRDALADALLRLRTDVVVSGLSARIRDRARERGAENPIAIADAALRLAGRLPGEGS